MPHGVTFAAGINATLTPESSELSKPLEHQHREGLRSRLKEHLSSGPPRSGIRRVPDVLRLRLGPEGGTTCGLVFELATVVNHGILLYFKSISRASNRVPSLLSPGLDRFSRVPVSL